MSTKEGLEKMKVKYNLANGWKYGGGNRRRVWIDEDEYILMQTEHSRYYENQLRPSWMEQGLPITNDYYPAHKTKCLCDHDISENCYIYKKDEDGNIKIRVVGNCCINRMGLQGKRCNTCDAVHKNLRAGDNYCNPCREDNARRARARHWSFI